MGGPAGPAAQQGTICRTRTEPCSRREGALACRGTMAGRRLAKALSPARMASRPRSGRWVAGSVSHLYLWVYGGETDRSQCGGHVCTCTSQMHRKEQRWAGGIVKELRGCQGRAATSPTIIHQLAPTSAQSTGTRRDRKSEVVKKDRHQSISTPFHPILHPVVLKYPPDMGCPPCSPHACV